MRKVTGNPRYLRPFPKSFSKLLDRTASRAAIASVERTGSSHFEATTDRVVDRGAAGTPGHDAERHRGPGDVNRPAVRYGQFDNQSHEEETQCRKARRQAKDKQNRKQDLARSR